MNHVSDNLERQLCEAYRAELPIYRHALALAADLTAAAAAGRAADEFGTQLLADLDQVAAIEATIADPRASWQALRQTSGPELSSLPGSAGGRAATTG